MNRPLLLENKANKTVRKQHGIAHWKHGQGSYIICFSMLRGLLGKRWLTHWLSLSVTHSSFRCRVDGKVSPFPHCRGVCLYRQMAPVHIMPKVLRLMGLNPIPFQEQERFPAAAYLT